MAVIIGNGAFRIWVGRNKETKVSNNIGIRIRPEKFPAGVDLDKTVEAVVGDIEELIRRRCPWV